MGPSASQVNSKRNIRILCCLIDAETIHETIVIYVERVEIGME